MAKEICKNLVNIIYKTTGLYRLFRNDKVSDQKLFQGHFANTVERMSEYKGKILVLCDSTFVSPSKKMDGLMDRGKGKENCLRVHYSLAVSHDGVQVLGILAYACISEKTKKGRGKLEKESEIWSKVAEESIMNIHTFNSDSGKILRRCTFVADREADDFDLMTKLKKLGLKFIIRSKHDRYVRKDDGDGVEKLSGAIGRAKKHGRRYGITTRKKNAVVKATVERRVLKGVVVPPRAEHKKTYNSMVLNMVQVREVGDAEDPVNWRLWTDEETGDFDSSAFVVVSYTHRWKIEELNKCAKTGVGVEDRQFTDVKRFSSFLAMAFVVAWRMLATRTVSEVEGGTAVADAFMEDEVEYLGLQAKAYKMEEIRTVAQAILLIAKMGGYLGTYKKPGWQVLWGGWMRFYERVIGFQVTKRYLKN